MTGHALTLEDTGRVGDGAHGAGLTAYRAGAVGVAKGLLAVTLDGALIAFTFAHAADIDCIAAGESICLDDIANVVGSAVIEPEFPERLLRSNICFVEMAFHGFVDLIGLCVAVAQLDCIVAVVLNGLLLHNRAGADLNDSDRNDFSGFIENLGHADFLADDTFFHLSFLL